jgi:hypothetical protein
MPPKDPQDELPDELVETAAEFLHQWWAGQLRLAIEACQVRPDGDLIIPNALGAQWLRQILTPYARAAPGVLLEVRASARQLLRALIALGMSYEW